MGDFRVRRVLPGIRRQGRECTASKPSQHNETLSWTLLLHVLLREIRPLRVLDQKLHGSRALLIETIRYIEHTTPFSDA